MLENSLKLTCVDLPPPRQPSKGVWWSFQALTKQVPGRRSTSRCSLEPQAPIHCRVESEKSQERSIKIPEFPTSKRGFSVIARVSPPSLAFPSPSFPSAAQSHRQKVRCRTCESKSVSQTYCSRRKGKLLDSPHGRQGSLAFDSFKC